MYAPLISALLAACPAPFILIDFITLTVFHEAYKI
jgi:hypothetical protein